MNLLLLRLNPVLIIKLVLCTGVNVSAPAYSQQENFCADLDYLIEQSESQFAGIRQRTQTNGGDTTTFLLDNADGCQITDSANITSYQCSWKYELGSQQAHHLLENLRSQIHQCIGSEYQEQQDKSVNHPDIYVAYFYELANGQLNLGLKNKAVTRNTYVSIRVDGKK